MGRQGIRGGLVPEASAASISCAAWEDQRGRKSGLATSLRIGAPRSHAIDRGRVKGDQASSPVGLIFLGGPINAGWNKIAAANVQTSDKASSPDAWTAKAQDVGETKRADFPFVARASLSRAMRSGKCAASSRRS